MKGPAYNDEATIKKKEIKQLSPMLQNIGLSYC